MRIWPALDVRDPGDSDLLLAALDDYQPTAIEARGAAGGDIRAFFPDAGRRDAALAAIAHRYPATPVEVSDEDWPRRSQEHLPPVTVGQVTIFPEARPPTSGPCTLVITPSMGFGTGHHATTRLCLAALQTLDLADAVVLDVGTGSGVLALVARLLGARAALGIDCDRDAIQSAEENLALNFSIDQVRFEVADFRSAALPLADVVTANLTGALLARTAPRLLRLLRPGGTLIVSGIQAHERPEVFAAFSTARLTWESDEDGWLGAAFSLRAQAEGRSR